MPLSIFVDALPYNEVVSKYLDWQEDMQVSELLPNIAYSSSLHWQLYCNKYPDDRGVLVDWVKEPEKRKSVCFLSTVLSPLDRCGNLGVITKKVLDRYVYRKNVFANIPFRFRKYFTEKGTYLFLNERTYRNESLFDGYVVVSQDEGHRTFDETVTRLNEAVSGDNKNIFAVFGFADSIGHSCRRGELYSERLSRCMAQLGETIKEYVKKYPNEEVLIISDHGMSTVERKVDLELEKHFGKQGSKSYIAYCDTAVMCIWCETEELKNKIYEYLETRKEGHLLTDADRERFGATDKKFGDIIYILREGTVFADNWFGKSLKKPNPNGYGMHGFWPEWEAHDQMATVILINGRRELTSRYEYSTVHSLITDVMTGEK